MSTPTAESTSTPVTAESTSTKKVYPAWDDQAGWDALAQKELIDLQRRLPKCGVCGRYTLSQYASNDLLSAYISNDRLAKCSCCDLCQSRAVTTVNNYHGTQCVSAANQTICFWTKEQREQHFQSVKSRIKAHGMSRSTCRACRIHFGSS